MTNGMSAAKAKAPKPIVPPGSPKKETPKPELKKPVKGDKPAAPAKKPKLVSDADWQTCIEWCVKVFKVSRRTVQFIWPDASTGSSAVTRLTTVDKLTPKILADLKSPEREERKRGLVAAYKRLADK